MKRFLGFSALFFALICFYAYQPMAIAEGWQPCDGESDSGCSIIESVHDLHGVMPPQSQLTVRTCYNLRWFLRDCQIVVKGVFCNVFEKQNHTVGFLIKFPKVDISFPFSVFW